ncbi:cytochrome P450 [Trametes versicolor FP-101664 SS1]|uniref:cytochrome P450 n=1 Tax=Trametes versicolor (strain FP-101664) TaxID=717944 RepID=UPI000462185A|nr:cytochrome P450 [Trametes versicolor FP-101664 SS1]EIW60950.1 cytochrome P450 [Trametes versicolor FP-101664 SS1]
MTPLQEAFAGAIVVYLAWRVARAFFATSPVDNIPGPKSPSFLAGHTAQVFGPDRWIYQEAFVKQYGRLFRINGPLNSNWLYTYDPKALHSIFVKDQDVFDENEVLLAAFMTLLGPGLLSTLGDQHRRQRKMLNPLFSAKHLREMTPVFNEIVGRLESAITFRVKDGPQEVDMLGWMGRTALELIGQGGLGHSFDPLTRDVADDFADSVKAYFPVIQQLEVFGPLLPLLLKMGPAWFRRKLVDLVPFAPARRMAQISDVMHARSTQIYEEKKAALEAGDEALKEQVSEGKDIISVLLRANMIAAEEDRLSSEEVIAQVSTLVLAGMDTTSNALARILSLLAEHQDVQQKLREEIVHARDGGSGRLRDLTYDEVMDLPYMDAICRETLRRYSPVTHAPRQVFKDAILPLSAPIRGVDGTLVHSVPVTKGMWVLADIQASNCNKELWGEDADEWKPERWLKPLPRALEDAHIPGVYSHLMTFIGGSRACIGFKFSQLEMKVMLASLLPALRFEPSGKPIYWNSAAVAFPSVGKDSRKPELPLKVTLL